MTLESRHGANDRNPFSSAFWAKRDADDHLRPPGTLSYVAGPSDDPLKFMTIPQFLDRACARNGAGDAAIFASGERLSWYDLRRRSDDVAAGLLALGVKRGDRVGIWAPNRAEWLYRSSAPRASARSWSTSTRPISAPSSNTRSTRCSAKC